MSRRKQQIIIMHPQAGGGFFGDVNSFLKKNKIVSRGLGAVGGMLPGGWGVAAKSIGGVAGQLGYGAKPRRKGRKPGPKPKAKKAPVKRRPRRK